MNRTKFHYQTGKYTDTVNSSLARFQEDRIIDRLWDHDHTVWKNDPAQIANRLGWLKSPVNMRAAVERIGTMVQNVRDEGYINALLLGMGGSSLAPDLLSKIFGAREGFLGLRVLDSTDPAAVRAYAENLDPVRTLYIVSTKSGTTTETLSFFRYYYSLTAKAAGPGSAGDHFIAITDPGSSLQTIASDLGFRDIYLNDPDIGGRYSALSFFGLVPAALLGIDIGLLLERAATMARGSESSNSPVQDNTGAVLGVLMGTLHNLGVNKLTLITSPSIFALGTWLEQLLAESTGKEGRGILPVEGEVPGPPSVYGPDRLFAYLRMRDDTTYDRQVLSLEKAGHPVVRITLDDYYDVGAEFFRWELATSVAGHIMGINPFDQPNVESAKAQAREMLVQYRKEGHLPVLASIFTESGVDVITDLDAGDLVQVIERFLAFTKPGSYVAIQAYINPTSEAAAALGDLRHRIRDRLKVATTVGFGPRFLHSTGQLHKGDGGNGLFIQITSEDLEDLPIPDDPEKGDSSITFGVLKAAQALGDRQALLDAGRRVIRFHMKGDVVEGIGLLTEKIG